MRILALDPATNCGWAHSSGDAGTWSLGAKRDESVGVRLLRLRGNLSAINKRLGVDFVIFEAARHAAPGMQGALVVQAELQGIIKAWCEDRGINYTGVSPSEVKKMATGKGNASKPDVLAAARRRWKKVGDDNEADARFILEIGKAQFGE